MHEKTILSSLNGLDTFIENQLNINIWVYLWTLNFFSIHLYPYLYTNIAQTWFNVVFKASFEIGKVQRTNFFLKGCFTISLLNNPIKWTSLGSFNSLETEDQRVPMTYPRLHNSKRSDLEISGPVFQACFSIALIPSFMQETFVKHLLCARHY